MLRLQQWLNVLYVNHYLRPQFDMLGDAPFFVRPRAIKLAGRGISAGRHFHVISEHHKPVNLSCWSSKQQQGQITIGDHCLVSPGVNIASAGQIIIEDNCMIAAEANISDCDWHGIYNRTRPFRCTSPVRIKKNAWIGLRAIVGKGVTVGENSIVAAGAVVASDVPDNTIVGGNPASPIKQLSASRRMLTREFLFRHNSNESDHYINNQRELEAFLFGHNTLAHWLRVQLFPRKGD